MTTKAWPGRRKPFQKIAGNRSALARKCSAITNKHREIKVYLDSRALSFGGTDADTDWKLLLNQFHFLCCCSSTCGVRRYRIRWLLKFVTQIQIQILILWELIPFACSMQRHQRPSEIRAGSKGGNGKGGNGKGGIRICLPVHCLSAWPDRSVR